MDLTDEQQSVFDEAVEFATVDTVGRSWFCYQGLAGCGKTVVMTKLARRFRESVLCAYTGKAASVLTRKGGILATTIHSAIYQFMGRGEDGDLAFEPKVEEGDWEGHIALLDECSMVPAELAQDLLDTGCRVIACGDPGQLPPVKGEQFFAHADAMLHTIHRQAWDSPIIRQAHSVRNTGQYRSDGDAFRVQKFVDREDILACDIILCWRNATRFELNRLKRAHMGLDGYARAGEPVMCLRNNHRQGVLNGAVYELQYDKRNPWDPIIVINERGQEVEIEGWIEDFEPRSDAEWPTPFSMGYAATVHKFQGSEADFVVLVDEYSRAEERRNWLYTGITRAARRILIQRSW